MNPTSEGQHAGQDPSLRNGEIDPRKVEELLESSYNAFEVAGMLMGLPDETISNSRGESYSREELIDNIAMATTAGGQPNKLTSRFGIRDKFFFEDGRIRLIIPKLEELPEVIRCKDGDKKGEIERIDLKDQMQLLGYLKAQELSGANALKLAEAIDDVEKNYRLGDIDIGSIDQYLKLGGIPRVIRDSVVRVITKNNRPGNRVLGFQRAFEEVSYQEEANEVNSELITKVPTFEENRESTKHTEQAVDRKQVEAKISELEASLEDPKYDDLKTLLNRKRRHEEEKKVAQKVGDGEASIRYGQYAGQTKREIEANYPELDAEYSKIQTTLYKLKKQLPRS